MFLNLPIHEGLQIKINIYLHTTHRMLSLQRPYANFLSFEIIDILRKMKLYSTGNLSNGHFELFSKCELFFVYKSLKLLLKVYL